MSDLGEELERSIASSELAPLNEGQIEEMFGAVDSVGALLGEELLPEIPVIKSIFALMKAGRSISDALLAKKIIRFLSQLDGISPEDRENFLSKLEGQDRERIVGNLLLVLEKHESFLKSEIQGRLLGALIKGELEKHEYLLLTHATSMINVQSLPDLTKFYGGQLDPSQATSLLYGFGFLELVAVDNSSIGTYGGGGPKFQETALGRKYVGLVEP